jgi:hypothetical protein
MASIKDQIVEVTGEILGEESEGLEYGELAERIRAPFEGTEIGHKIQPNKGWLNRALYFYAEKPDSAFSPLRFFRIESPRISIRWA